jgi:hypothetical protein
MPLFGIVSYFIIPQSAAGQKSVNRVPVTIAIGTYSSSGNAPFVIQRRREIEPLDVIILSPWATDDDLANAVRALLLSRQIAGDTSLSAAKLGMRPDLAHRGTARQYPWVRRVLVDLKRADRNNLPGVGYLQSVRIWLPPQGGGPHLSRTTIERLRASRR